MSVKTQCTWLKFLASQGNFFLPFQFVFYIKLLQEALIWQSETKWTYLSAVPPDYRVASFYETTLFILSFYNVSSPDKS